LKVLTDQKAAFRYRNAAFSLLNGFPPVFGFACSPQARQNRKMRAARANPVLPQ